METRRQGTTLFTAILVLIATLVAIQLWIVAAGLSALLGNAPQALVPAAVASVVLFVVNGGLLLYIIDFDHRLRRLEPHE